MGRTTSLTAVALLLVLSGCSGDADPAPAPPSSSAPSSPTASPTPTPPVMPEAAKAHTEAGAKAFVEYFWEVVDYAGQSLDPAPLSALTADGCIGCQGAINFVKDMRSGHATFIGADTHVDNFAFDTIRVGGMERTEALFDVTTPEQVADYPGDKRDEHYPAVTARTRFYLRSVPAGWRVVLWESA